MGAVEAFEKLFEQPQSQGFNERRFTHSPRITMTGEQLEAIANKLREVEEMLVTGAEDREISVELYYIIGVLDGHAEKLKEQAKPVMRGESMPGEKHVID